MAITKAERNRRTAEAAAVVARANANPDTLCCNCHRPLSKCGPRGDGRNRNGTPCTWQGGHPSAGPGQPPRWHTPELRAECSHCNQRDGAAAGNRNREPHTSW